MESAATIDGIRARPRLRGVLHAVGFVVACIVGAFFVGATDGKRLVAAAVFAGSAVAMLGASALYHRVWWSARARPLMRVGEEKDQQCQRNRRKCQ